MAYQNRRRKCNAKVRLQILVAVEVMRLEKQGINGQAKSPNADLLLPDDIHDDANVDYSSEDVVSSSEWERYTLLICPQIRM